MCCVVIQPLFWEKLQMANHDETLPQRSRTGPCHMGGSLNWGFETQLCVWDKTWDCCAIWQTDSSDTDSGKAGEWQKLATEEGWFFALLSAFPKEYWEWTPHSGDERAGYCHFFPLPAHQHWSTSVSNTACPPPSADRNCLHWGPHPKVLQVHLHQGKYT